MTELTGNFVLPRLSPFYEPAWQKAHVVYGALTRYLIFRN